MEELFLRFHAADQVLIDLLRITVEHPDPENAADLSQVTDQFVQAPASIQIGPVKSCLLRNQDQLLHAL